MSGLQGEADDASSGARKRITHSIIALHKEHFGRGPVRGKTYLLDDSVLVLMSDGHTTAEKTLGHDGGDKAVASQRVMVSDAIREPLTTVIEGETGRKVVGFLSSSQQDPSLISYVFVLEVAEVLKPIDDTDQHDQPPRSSVQLTD